MQPHAPKSYGYRYRVPVPVTREVGGYEALTIFERKKLHAICDRIDALAPELAQLRAERDRLLCLGRGRLRQRTRRRD